MKEIIGSRLLEIEQEYGVRILFACESGSRGWGFPSTDSDYDVRFIYAWSRGKYLSIHEEKSDLNFPINSELDINGWDIKKVLQLVYKSNVTPFEWLQSPIIYSEEVAFRNELWSLCSAYFNQKSNIHHYLGISKMTENVLINEQSLRLKKLFYILRSILAAKWCLERNSIAPMELEKLMVQLPEPIHKEVLELVNLKARATEDHVILPSETLLSFIRNEYESVSMQVKDIRVPEIKSAEILNRFFNKTIRSNDNTGN